ncbi:hypothetical protein [Deinococcus soli (ex Cha et al. 2016)]|uniref:Methyltransferase n=2 Tax=Deinococcus soli (ex Cha et al. 2016) TaxID=1309411 RepID=A0ACC6KH60_9DEIO|nr:hypothetical protein [Deinococcus soli (ex Cha et al. 2016)]MDR6218949.1 putative methyltransferase [Deinococcus soli (ex Cha et al. 2016)]MDR6328746.1 putative methyltransferase [Deinococcus soli (ex Cha et al. 2016)]MDR6751767.1 putative methyltransferase [Deinococcus soli (ex Cha et al. 2016)]
MTRQSPQAYAQDLTAQDVRFQEHPTVEASAAFRAAQAQDIAAANDAAAAGHVGLTAYHAGRANWWRHAAREFHRLAQSGSLDRHL